jgi:hypothetical protein
MMSLEACMSPIPSTVSSEALAGSPVDWLAIAA